ncbi:MAG: chemotaxis protein CheW [Candidatus Eisenbacteria bacterium]
MRTEGTTPAAAGSRAQQMLDVVCFQVAGCEYCVDVDSVLGVNPLIDVRPVPGVPSFVRGVVDIRGRVIPILGLRERLGAEPAEDDIERRIVVVRTKSGMAGMVVDAVTRIWQTHADDVSEPPAGLGAPDCVSGVARMGDEIVLMLDLDVVVDTDLAGPLGTGSQIFGEMNSGGEDGN